MKKTLGPQRRWSAVAYASAVALLGITGLAARPAQAEQVTQTVDPAIASAVKAISPARVQADIEKLVSFDTRSTLSAQDAAAISAGRGIGAAREWLRTQLAAYSTECGGCLEVKTDEFVQPVGPRVPQPTTLINVYAVLKGSDPESAKRIVLVTGHYDSRNTNVLDKTGAAL